MNGQCLCGHVQFSVIAKSNNITACHCSICRKQSGGISLALEVDGRSLIFQDQSMLAIFHSSEWAHRGFCKNCGTIIFWQLNDQSYCNVNHFLINFELATQLTLTTEIFIEDKPEYYEFSNKTHKMTEKDLLNL